MLWAWILDGILIAIVVFSARRGWKNGFVTSLFEMGRFIVAFAVAMLFRKPLSEFLLQSAPFVNMRESMTVSLTQKLSALGENLTPDEMTAAFAEKNPTLMKALELFGIDLDAARTKLADLIGGGVKDLSQGMAQYIVEPAMRVIAVVAAFVALFLVTLLLTFLLQMALNELFKLPLLRGVNKAGGLVIGLLCAFLYVSLYCLLVKVLLLSAERMALPIPPDLVERTVLLKALSEYNLFTFISHLFTGNPVF